MPSTSTSGPHQRIRTSWASASASSTRSSGSRRTSSTCASSRPLAPLEHLLAGDVEESCGDLHGRGFSRAARNAARSSSRALGHAPEHGRAGVRARSSRLQRAARSGSLRPRADDDARAAQRRGAQRLEGQRGVVERAQPGAGDDEHRRVEQRGDVGERPAVGRRSARAARRRPRRARGRGRAASTHRGRVAA